jgi:hypothetical protein
VRWALGYYRCQRGVKVKARCVDDHVLQQRNIQLAFSVVLIAILTPNLISVLGLLVQQRTDGLEVLQ